jgi:uncharacterized protein (DUF433 family)
MNWRDHIHSDPAVLAGKPVVRGTRLAADFILGLFASGWTQEQVLESYPQLTPEALRAVFAFAAEKAAEIAPPRQPRTPRRPGSARGQVHMADDFDATPEDFGDD